VTQRVPVRILPQMPVPSVYARSTLNSMPACRPPAPAAPLLSLSAVPFIRMAPRELCQQSLDAGAAFVLGLLDGRTCVDEVLDTCPLDQHEVLRLLRDLLAKGIIAVREDLDTGT